MATYRIYQDRNAWREGATVATVDSTIEGAKARAVVLGATHVESETGATVYRSQGAWRKA